MLKRIFALSLSVCLLSGCVDTAMTGASLAYDRHDLTQQFSDRSITFTVREHLFEHPDVYDKSNLDVTTFNGVVLLAGQVPSEAARKKAAYLAATAKGAKKVYNFITVGKETSSWRKTKDYWITTKLEAQLLTTHGVDPSEIKLLTENGVVYLLGEVSDRQAAIATQLARTTDGVKKVVQIFQYIKLMPHPAAKD